MTRFWKCCLNNVLLILGGWLEVMSTLRTCQKSRYRSVRIRNTLVLKKKGDKFFLIQMCFSYVLISTIFQGLINESKRSSPKHAIDITLPERSARIVLVLLLTNPGPNHESGAMNLN